MCITNAHLPTDCRSSEVVAACLLAFCTVRQNGVEATPPPPILTAIFQVNLGWLVLFKLRMMEVVVRTGAITRAIFHSNRHHQQTDTQLFTGRMPFLSPNQQRQSTEGKLNVLYC